MHVYGGIGPYRKRAFSIYGFDTQIIYDPLIAASVAPSTMNAIVIEGRNLAGRFARVCTVGLRQDFALWEVP
jgi:hypothetical protein